MSQELLQKRLDFIDTIFITKEDRELLIGFAGALFGLGVSELIYAYDQFMELHGYKWDESRQTYTISPVIKKVTVVKRTY